MVIKVLYGKLQSGARMCWPFLVCFWVLGFWVQFAVWLLGCLGVRDWGWGSVFLAALPALCRFALHTFDFHFSAAKWLFGHFVGHFG